MSPVPAFQLDARHHSTAISGTLAEAMQFGVLGPLQVTSHGIPLALGGTKQRAVLALLLLDANRVVSVDRLIDGVWGDRPPNRAASTLQVYLANLRKVLEPDRSPGSPTTMLHTRPPGYILEVPSQQVDVNRFEALAGEGRAALSAGRAAPASVLLREALAIWRGRPLEDLPEEIFAPGMLARLDELKAGVIEDRIEADLASGRHLEVVGELEALVAEYPFRERLAGQWILALYRCGRQRDALAAFAGIRSELVDELGLEPSAELRALEQAILCQDPLLAAPSAVPLEGNEIERLIRASTGQAPDASTVKRIQLETKGNAAAVERAVRDELMRAATERLASSLAEAEATSEDLERATETAAEYVLEVQRTRRAGPSSAAHRELDPEGTPPAPVACPYKGLIRYEVEDAVWFHGRERLTAELLARVGTSRFVGVVGTSGAGKSSLVRAGLLAAIRDGALPGSERWPAVVVVPGRDPIDELARVLSTACGRTVEHTRACLDEGPAALAVLLSDSTAVRGDPFVLLVDQFEELYTICTNPEQRAHFIDLIATGATDADCPLVVIAAVRADYFGRCADNAELAELFRGSMLVGAMERDELRRAIEGPARVAGVALEDGLTDRVLADVADEPGALPLLSAALVATWERRRGRTLSKAGYEDVGGVRGALARSAEDAYTHLRVDQQGLARGIFLRLAEPGVGLDDVRRRAPLDELLIDDANADVLEILVERRLVVAGEQTAEIAHEALFRQWPRLREWLELDRDSRRTLRRLTDSASDWDSGGRDPDLLDRGARLAVALEVAAAYPDDVNTLEREFLDAAQARRDHELNRARRTSRRLKLLASGLAVLVVAALVAGAIAVSQRRDADRQRSSAVEQRGLAEQQRSRAQEQQRVAEEQSRAAQEQRRVAEEQRTRAEAESTRANATRLAAQSRTVVASDPSLALLLAAQGVELADSQVTRRGLLFAIGETSMITEVTHRYGDHPWAAAIDDSRHLAVSDGASARVWDADTNEPRGPALSGTDGVITALWFVPGRTELLATTGGGAIAWDWQTGAIIWRSSTDVLSSDNGGVASAAMAPSGKYLAVGTRHSEIDLIDTATGQIAATRALYPSNVDNSGAWVTDLVWQRDETLVFLLSDDPAIKRWDTTRDELLPDLATGLDHNQQPWSLQLSPDGTLLGVGTAMKVGEIGSDVPAVVALVNWPAGTLAAGPFDEHFSTVRALMWSPDGATLLSIGEDTRVVVRDGRTGQPRGGPRTGLVTGPTLGLLFIDDETVLFTNESGTRVARLTPQPVLTALRADGHAGDVAFTPDGTAVGILIDNRVRLVSLPSASPLGDDWDLGGPLLFDMAFSPDGSKLAVSGSSDPTIPLDTGFAFARANVGWVRVFDVSTGAPVSPVLGLDSAVELGVDWSPDGSRLVAIDGAGTFSSWDAATWSTIVDRHLVSSASSPDYLPLWTVEHLDASHVVAVGFDGHARIIDSATGDVIADRAVLYGALVFGADVSPDRSTIAVAGGGGVAEVDAQTLEPRRPLSSTSDTFWTVAYSPDGSTLAAVDEGGRTYLWDVASGEQIAEPFADVESGMVSTGLEWSPDGRLLGQSFFGSQGLDLAIVRDLTTPSLIETACRVAGRDLTQAEWEFYMPDVPYRSTC